MASDTSAAVRDGPCPLCGGRNTTAHHREPNRDYWRCRDCALAYLAPSQRPALDKEVARYALHRNRARCWSTRIGPTICCGG